MERESWGNADCIDDGAGGNFRYIGRAFPRGEHPPVVLPAGSYVVAAAFFVSGDAYTANQANLTSIPQVSFAGAAFMSGNSFGLPPLLNANQQSYFGANVHVQPTLAKAGPDQSVNENTLVTLDGSQSTGAALTYQWSQVAGPPVSLNLTDPVRPTFAAPHCRLAVRHSLSSSS